MTPLPLPAESAPRLTIRRIDYRSDLLILAVHGEIDAANVDVLECHVRSNPPPMLVVDLGKVDFLSAAGIQCLVRAFEQAGAEGRRLEIVASTRLVRRALRITSVAAKLPMYATLSDAIRELPTLPGRFRS